MKVRFTGGSLTDPALSGKIKAGGGRMGFDKQAYDLAYLKANVVLKNISFNRKKPEDMELLAWVMAQPNANRYIKNLIREDYERKKQTAE